MKLKIKEARQKAGLSQKELAQKLGIAAPTLSGYESGAHDPGSNKLQEIARICDVTVDFLLGREKESPDAEQSVEELNEVEEQLVTLLRQLPPEHQKMVPGILQSILDSLK